VSIHRLQARYGRLPLIGSGVLTASVLALLFVSWRAIELEPLPEPAPPSTQHEGSATTTPPARLESPALAALLDANPFHPDRRRPAERYQPPTDESSDAAAPSANGGLILTGTILYPDGGGAAIVKQGRQPSQIVRRGAALGALTLTSVERGRATFTASDGSPVVLVSTEEGGS
jgi:hypothetical protein